MTDDPRETLLGLPIVETEDMDGWEPVVFGPPMFSAEEVADMTGDPRDILRAAGVDVPEVEKWLMAFRNDKLVRAYAAIAELEDDARQWAESFKLAEESIVQLQAENERLRGLVLKSSGWKDGGGGREADAGASEEG